MIVIIVVVVVDTWMSLFNGCTPYADLWRQKDVFVGTCKTRQGLKDYRILNPKEACVLLWFESFLTSSPPAFARCNSQKKVKFH